MKYTLQFKYKKETNNPSHLTEEKKVIPLWENPTSIEGLSCDKMTEEDKNQIISLIKEFNEKMKPYVKKYYRKYLQENIIGPVTRSELPLT